MHKHPDNRAPPPSSGAVVPTSMNGPLFHVVPISSGWPLTELSQTSPCNAGKTKALVRDAKCHSCCLRVTLQIANRAHRGLEVENSESVNESENGNVKNIESNKAETNRLRW